MIITILSIVGAIAGISFLMLVLAVISKVNFSGVTFKQLVYFITHPDVWHEDDDEDDEATNRALAAGSEECDD